MKNFELGDMVLNKHTLRTGEILKKFPCGHVRVRYPIFNDEDRDFDIFEEPVADLHAIDWHRGMKDMYQGRYPHGKGEWYVPR